MTRHLLILVVLAATTTAGLRAQDCTPDRYITDGLFDVDTTREVLFGRNIAVNGTDSQDLFLDVYEPSGDDVTERPVLFVGFGGSFIGGSRGDVSNLCHRWASRGFVAVAFDYRVGFFIPDELATLLAVSRGMHDMRAAIRYMYRDAATGNIYGIDTNRVIAAGVSAGAVTALQVAYLDDVSEVPAVLMDTLAALGGLEGESGVPGFSSRVHAVVNFSGALGDTAWLDPGDPVLISLHDDGDETVPYDTREIIVGIPTGLVASGSGDITRRAQSVGVPSCLQTIPGDGHVSYLRGSAVFNTDSTFAFLDPWLKDVVCGTAEDCDSEVVTTSVRDRNAVADLQLTPNPATDRVEVRWPPSDASAGRLHIVDALGRTVRERAVAGGAAFIDLAGLPAGTYQVMVRGETVLHTSTLLVP